MKCRRISSVRGSGSCQRRVHVSGRGARCQQNRTDFKNKQTWDGFRAIHWISRGLHRHAGSTLKERNRLETRREVVADHGSALPTLSENAFRSSCLAAWAWGGFSASLQTKPPTFCQTHCRARSNLADVTNQKVKCLHLRKRTSTQPDTSLCARCGHLDSILRESRHLCWRWRLLELH